MATFLKNNFIFLEILRKFLLISVYPSAIRLEIVSVNFFENSIGTCLGFFLFFRNFSRTPCSYVDLPQQFFQYWKIFSRLISLGISLIVSLLVLLEILRKFRHFLEKNQQEFVWKFLCPLFVIHPAIVIEMLFVNVFEISW